MRLSRAGIVAAGFQLDLILSTLPILRSQAGADANAIDENGNKPIMVAAGVGDAALTNLLFPRTSAPHWSGQAAGAAPTTLNDVISEAARRREEAGSDMDEGSPAVRMRTPRFTRIRARHTLVVCL